MTRGRPFPSKRAFAEEFRMRRYSRSMARGIWRPSNVQNQWRSPCVNGCSRSDNRLFQPFWAQTWHQPPAGTLLPAKIVHAAVASAALPWNCAQVLHFWPALNVGWVLLSILVASLTNPNALAVGSLGSSGGSAAAAALPDMRLNVGNNAPAMKTLLTMDRREILRCMNSPLRSERMSDIFPHFAVPCLNNYCERLLILAGVAAATIAKIAVVYLSRSGG